MTPTIAIERPTMTGQPHWLSVDRSIECPAAAGGAVCRPGLALDTSARSTPSR